MNISDFEDLINGISGLPDYQTLLNNYNDGSPKLYEIFIFLLVIESLEKIPEVDKLKFVNLDNDALNFRGAPGRIYNGNYSYVKFDFNKNNSTKYFELHLGIQHDGDTNLHEFDISIISEEKAVYCRKNRKNPRSSALIGIECKEYSNTLGLHLARAFQGLIIDLKQNKSGYYYFVSNNTGNSVENYFSHKSRPKFMGNIAVTNVNDYRFFVEYIRNDIKRTLVYNSIRN